MDLFGQAGVLRNDFNDFIGHIARMGRGKIDPELFFPLVPEFSNHPQQSGKRDLFTLLVQPVRIDILSQQGNAFVTFFHQIAQFAQYFARRPRNFPATGVGHGTVSTEFIATVLYGNKSLPAGAVLGRNVPKIFNSLFGMAQFFFVSRQNGRFQAKGCFVAGFRFGELHFLQPFVETLQAGRRYHAVLMNHFGKVGQFVHGKYQVKLLQELFAVGGQHTTGNKSDEVFLVFPLVPLLNTRINFVDGLLPYRAGNNPQQVGLFLPVGGFKPHFVQHFLYPFAIRNVHLASQLYNMVFHFSLFP